MLSVVSLLIKDKKMVAFKRVKK